jgi:hypothetical protein
MTRGVTTKPEPVVWEEPGAHGKTRSKWDVIQAELIAHPGDWALLWVKPQHSVVPRQFRTARFERKYRSEWIDGQRVHKAYVRYLG